MNDEPTAEDMADYEKMKQEEEWGWNEAYFERMEKHRWEEF